MPKKIILLDNDFFGQVERREKIEEIKSNSFHVCFTQGINLRLLTEGQAVALSEIEYRDINFTCRRLYTAWDNLKQENIFFQGVKRLKKAGIPAKHIMVYMLIGYESTETWEQIFYRFNRIVSSGMLPFPMVYNNMGRGLKSFQRWAVTGLYRAVSWKQYNNK